MDPESCPEKDFQRGQTPVRAASAEGKAHTIQRPDENESILALV